MQSHSGTACLYGPHFSSGVTWNGHVKNTVAVAGGPAILLPFIHQIVCDTAELPQHPSVEAGTIANSICDWLSACVWSWGLFVTRIHSKKNTFLVRLLELFDTVESGTCGQSWKAPINSKIFHPSIFCRHLSFRQGDWAYPSCLGVKSGWTLDL